MGQERVAWAKMAVVLVTARLKPSSELYRGAALDDLSRMPAERINDDRLYRALDRLLPHKLISRPRSPSPALNRHRPTFGTRAWRSCRR